MGSEGIQQGSGAQVFKTSVQQPELIVSASGCHSFVKEIAKL